MDSRMSKYENIDNDKLSRVKKNENLYNNINHKELENFNVNNNTTVIGENRRNEIDIDKIKKILDTKYNEEPKRRSIRLEKEETEYDLDIENTKEYDINTILNKAKEDKPLSYEEERLKKIRDTQYNILNNLNLESELQKKEEKEDELDLQSLINTITINESKIKSEMEDTGDLFDDFKSSGKTEITPVIENTIKTPVEVKSIDEVKENRVSSKTNVKEDFYTSSVKFDKKDFEDLDIEDKSKRNIIMEIIIVIILLAFIVGMYLFFKSILNF